MNIVAYNIRRIMEEKGLKQKYVAERSGFTAQEFSNMMNGRKSINVQYIRCICAALDVNPNDLFELQKSWCECEKILPPAYGKLIPRHKKDLPN